MHIQASARDHWLRFVLKIVVAEITPATPSTTKYAIETPSDPDVFASTTTLAAVQAAITIDCTRNGSI